MLDLQAIKNNYLVYGLTDDQLRSIANLASERLLQPGDALCHEGEKGDDLFIVIEGEFQVTVGGERLAEIGPGSVIGEMGLIQPRPRSATVEAIQPSRVAAISQGALRQELTENGDLGFVILCNVARLLSDRLRTADGKLAALMGTTVKA